MKVLPFPLVIFSIGLSMLSLAKAEESMPPVERKIILENSSQFLRTERNFDLNNASLSEVMGYIEIAAREHWNRLADAGVAKNKTFRNWKIRYVESDKRFTYVAKSTPIVVALEALCASNNTISIFDESGMILVPDSIILDKDRYQLVSKHVYVKKE